MSDALPTIPIGKLIEKVVSWNPPRDAPDDELDYIDLSSVDNTTKQITANQTVIGREAPSRARQRVKAGDILVSTVRPNLNGVARVPDHLNGATASTGFCVLRPQATKLDASYLFHWVQSAEFVGDMMRKATGASYPAVSDKIIAQSEILLPPLDEQKRIASILDQADELRRKRQRAIDRLNQLGQAIFQEMFGKILFRENGAGLVHLSDLVSVQSGYAFKSADFAEEGNPIIRISNLDGSNVSFQDAARIPTERLGKGERYELQGGDLLIAMSGATTGKIGLVPKLNERAFLNQRVGKYEISDRERMKVSFLRYLVTSPDYQKFALSGAWGAAQPNVSGKQLVDMRIALPSVDEQNVFSDKVSQAKDLSVHLLVASSSTDNLFQALQHRAFQGEL